MQSLHLRPGCFLNSTRRRPVLPTSHRLPKHSVAVFSSASTPNASDLSPSPAAAQLPKGVTTTVAVAEKLLAVAAAPMQQQETPVQQQQQQQEAPVQQEAEVPSPSSSSREAPEEEDANTIYLGFQKGDYDRSVGRKGRTVKDDPAKYPTKDTLGPFLYATGGWAGGEVGLQRMLAEEEAKKGQKKAAPAPKLAVPTAADTRSKLKGSSDKDKELIYLGWDKTPEDLVRRAEGQQGKMKMVTKEEARVYPGKDDLGLFLGATGGFAGGEAGLKEFVKSGKIKLQDPSRPDTKRQFSLVAILGIVALAGVGGGIFLTYFFDAGESFVANEAQEVSKLSVDNDTKTLLVAAVALLGAAGAVVAGRAAMGAVQEGVRSRVEGASRVVVTAAFCVVCLLVARTVLEL